MMPLDLLARQAWRALAQRRPAEVVDVQPDPAPVTEPVVTVTPLPPVRPGATMCGCGWPAYPDCAHYCSPRPNDAQWRREEAVIGDAVAAAKRAVPDWDGAR